MSGQFPSAMSLSDQNRDHQRPAALRSWKVWAGCLLISVGGVATALWLAELKLERQRTRMAREAESGRKLETLIAQHSGDAKAAMLAFANKVERTDDGEVVELSFDYTAITDDDLQQLQHFPELRTLSLVGTTISGRGLEYLKPLEKLRTLSLYYTSIDDVALQHVTKCQSLCTLILVGTRVTGEGINSLRDLPNLGTLALELTSLTDAQIADLKQLRQLHTLDLISTKVSEAGVAELRTALPHCEIYGP